MTDAQNKEAGPAKTESGFAFTTKPDSNAVEMGYAQCQGQRNKKWLTFDTPAGRSIITARQVGRTLAALVFAGGKGVTALEMSSWAYRLGAYIHRLRHDYGLDIETFHEPHDGGWHGRYVLHTPVRMIGGAS